MKFFVDLKPLALSLAAWIMLLVPSKIPLSILVLIINSLKEHSSNNNFRQMDTIIVKELIPALMEDIDKLPPSFWNKFI